VTSQTVPVARADARPALVCTRPLTQVRLAFIDNLRILLVVLVILHHLALTYGAEGPWYYSEGQADTITAMVLTLFVAVNEAFFMGFYFLIAAYFVPPSLERKGSRQFLRERFLRLGMVISLLVTFRRRYDRQGGLARDMSTRHTLE